MCGNVRPYMLYLMKNINVEGMFSCIQKHSQMHIYMHTHTHTHTQTQPPTPTHTALTSTTW